MRRLARAVALVAALASGSAQSAETFTVIYGGTARISVDCFIKPLACGIFDYPWTAVMTLQTLSGDDGVYVFHGYPPDYPSSTLTFFSLISDKSPNPSFVVFDASSLDEPIGNNVLSATVQGGRVVSIDGGILGGSDARWGFAGQGLVFEDRSVPKFFAEGHAVMIPEPSTSALMIGGLALLWGARRRT